MEGQRSAITEGAASQMNINNEQKYTVTDTVTCVVATEWAKTRLSSVINDAIKFHARYPFREELLSQLERGKFEIAICFDMVISKDYLEKEMQQIVAACMEGCIRFKKRLRVIGGSSFHCDGKDIENGRLNKVGLIFE